MVSGVELIIILQDMMKLQLSVDSLDTIRMVRY